KDIRIPESSRKLITDLTRIRSEQGSPIRIERDVVVRGGEVTGKPRRSEGGGGGSWSRRIAQLHNTSLIIRKPSPSLASTQLTDYPGRMIRSKRPLCADSRRR
ncbi:hypothetical protein J6590_035106, partial [Homalodisca vitripennis]